MKRPKTHRNDVTRGGRRGPPWGKWLALALALAPLAGRAAEATPVGSAAGVNLSGPVTVAFNPADPADALVMSQTSGVFDLAQRFEAPLGLRGYLVVSELGQPVVLYTDPAGTHLLLGALLTANGENAATAVLSDYMDQHLLPTLYNAFGAATFIHQGSARAPLVYVLFDPACAHCAQLYRDLAPRVAAEEVAVRWIPVNTLGDGEAAARLADAARQGQGDSALAAALAPVGEADSATAATPASPAGFAAVANNQQLFEALGASGTPQLFYQAKSGSFQLVRGAPDADELALILQSLPPVPPAADGGNTP